MKKIYFFKKLLLLATILFGAKLVAQPCYSGASFGTANITAFTNTYTNINTCTYGGEYNTLTVGVSGVFSFSASGGTGNYLTISTGISTGSIAAGVPPLTVNLSAGTYYLHVATSSTCGTESLCHTTSYTNAAVPGSPTITLQPNNLNLCSGSNGSFVMNASSNAASFQWESSTGGPFTALTNVAPYSGVTTKTLNITGATNPLNNTQYRCVATNTTGNVATNVVVLTVVAGVALPLVENFNASTIFPTLWQVNATNPWYVFSNHGTVGTNGMSRNLYGTTQTLAIAQTPNTGVVTSSTSLTFDYRIMEYSGYPGLPTPTASIANDSLKIFISTNCGQTFTLLGSINAGNHVVSTNFVSKTYNLAAYAGNSVVIRFRANKDVTTFSDYYVDIDNINLSNVVPLDGGVTGFIAPINGRPCYNTNEPIIVTVKNWGTASLSNIPVKASVTGAVTSVISSTLAGPLAAGASVNYTVGTLNMSTAGVYNFKCYTDIAADPTKGNDTLLPVVQVTVNSNVVTPLPYFEDFNALSFNLPTTWINNPSFSWNVGTNHGTSASNGMFKNLFGTFSTKAETDMLRLGVVTPSTALKFDYRLIDYSGFPTSPATPTSAIVGDSVNVWVSTNCGSSYSLLGSINSSNHVASTAFVSKTYNMASFAGQNVVIRFTASKFLPNTADYYVDIDNINVYNASAVDAGVSSLAASLTNTCYVAATPISVVLNNFGTAPISNIPVTVTISVNASTQTITTTYAPSIPVGGSVTVLVGNANMSLPGTYTIVSASNLAGDGNSSNNSNLTTIVNPVIAAISGQTTACIGSSITLNASGSAISYTWSNSATTTSISVSPSVNTTYSVTGTSALGCTFTAVKAITVINPTITANNTSTCGTGTLTGTLTATSFGPINWYATPTSTTVLGTGNSFPVSAISTTTYYAQASSQTVNQGGLANNTVVAGGAQQQSTNYNIFDVFTTCIIQDVLVYPGAVGNVVIDLRDNLGALIQSVTVPVTNTTTGVVIPLNFTVLPGTGYRLGQGAGSVSMYRTSATGNIYPLTIPGVLDITNSAAGNSFYYFCYNWTVISPGCTSPRVPSVFTIGSLGSLAASPVATVCPNSVVTLTASGANSYLWSPGGSTLSTVTFTAGNATIPYTVIGFGSTPTCSASIVSGAVVVICTNLDEKNVALESINVMPNPTNGIINVVLPNKTETTYFEVMDVTGKVVLSQRLTQLNSVIDATNLANGLYVYKIINDNRTVKQGKIVKQ
jgi:trimeric autotransporter adhesin